MIFTVKHTAFSSKIIVAFIFLLMSMSLMARAFYFSQRGSLERYSELHQRTFLQADLRAPPKAVCKYCVLICMKDTTPPMPTDVQR